MTLHEKLQPLADTATEIIYSGENCIVAYGGFLTAGMGVRFEIIEGSSQHGIGMRLIDVAGKLDRAAYAASARLKELLKDEQTAVWDEINDGADALAAWAPFSQMAEAPPPPN